MMYPRLKLARNLLTEDGAIVVNIDGGEVANLELLLNDIFGEENRVVNVVWQKRVSPANDAKWFSSDHDLILIYAKNKEEWRPNKLSRTAEQLAYYKNPDNDPKGPWNSATYTCNKNKDERPNLYYPIENPHTGEEVWPKETAVWKYGQEVTAEHIEAGRLYWGAEGRAAYPRIKLYLSEMDNVVPRSVWNYEDAGHTQAATTELKELFGGDHVFDSPKPVKLLERVIELGCAGEGEVVLDFFGGSGTTAHAVFTSAVQGRRTRFILVQLPEPIDSARFKSIADITKERLRLAGARLKSALQIGADKGEIQSELSLRESASSADQKPLDTGFRVFKLDHSNIRAWNPSSDDLEASLFAQQDHLLEGRSETDVLYELLLKLGLDLCVPMKQRSIHDKAVHAVGGGVLLACLTEKISATDVEALASGIVAWHQALAPAGDSTCVFRDSAFADDVAKTNMTAILQQHGIANVRSL